MRAQKADRRRHHHRILRHGGYDWVRTGRNANPRALVAKQLLPYCFAWPQIDAAAIHEHNRTCRSRIARCTRAVAAAAADGRIFDAAPRRCAGVDSRSSKTESTDIATDEIHVGSAFGAKPIRVLTYRPVTSNDPLPAIVHIHGGGFVMGAPEMKDAENRLFASELRCAIYSVDHRLAPESPHPAPADATNSVFSWLQAEAERLGVRARR